jgi:predicted esterase
MEDPEAWLPLIQESQNDGLRAYIIVGDEDESINFENIQALADMLNDGGIPCDLEEVPHAGSEFVPEFEESLQRGIEFILNG